MKFFVFVLLCAIATVSANCGCLKCSKHVGLANEYIAEPKFCGPVKILYRGPKFGEYNCGQKKGDAHPHGGYNNYCYGRYPITVQKPVVPPADVPLCVPLVGLRACVDRVVLPAPESRRCDRNGPQIQYTSGPMLEAFDVDNYRYHDYRPHYSCGYEQFLKPKIFNVENPSYSSKTRAKRNIPIVGHGFKFFVNMMPPFVKEPIRNAVNLVAGPEKSKEKTKYIMISPSFQNDYKKKKPTSFNLKDRLLYNIRQRKNENIQSLLKKKRQRISPRSNFPIDSEEISSEETTRFWLRELKPSDILDKHSEDYAHSIEEEKEKYRMDKKSKQRTKRSIIMDSEEFSVPLYQVDVDDHPGEDLFVNEYENDDIDEDMLQSRRMRYHYDPREQMMRRAIKEELRKFKKVGPAEKFGHKKITPHSPILHLLTLPFKFFRSFGNPKGSALTVVPKLIVGTKNYFRDFGKNFKKHALDFASDVIGDFDHAPYQDQLSDILVPRRYKRDISSCRNDPDSETQNRLFQKFSTKLKQPYGRNPFFRNDPDVKSKENRNVVDSKMQNFRNSSENKVRKKRYIVKVVDEDEVEEYLRRKLEKMYKIPQKSRRPHYVRETHSEEESWTVEDTSHMYDGRRNSYEDYEKAPHKKISVERVRPKLIIDNHGLPFMEMNGFKRPIFMKNDKSDHRYHDEIVGSSHFIPIDSSEEVDRDKIDHIIGFARNTKRKDGKNNDVPINTIKKKMSDLLYETDELVHIDFWKYHDIYDDLLEIQHIKSSIVQDWKKIVMEKRINDYKAKVNLLGKFKSLQHIKDIAVHNIVNTMYKETSNSFILCEFTKTLVKLHKLQCIINKVVSCFEEKFKMGTKFDMENEIKFVDFLAKINFAGEKTRNDMIAKLKKIRDIRLQSNIKLLDKLKKSLIDENDACIEEEANLIWELRNIEKMRKRTLEEMHQKLMDGYRIKKHMKILFDLTNRLHSCEKELKQECAKNEFVGNSKDESKEEGTEGKKKFNMDEFKQKMQEKIEKYKEVMKEKKEKLKKKYKKESNEND